MKWLLKPFPFLIGLMVGLAVGYVLAERQPVPPARALKLVRQDGGEQLPPGHPPLEKPSNPEDTEFEQQVTSLTTMLAQEPDNVEVMTALGNLYFDHARWEDAEHWYRESLKRNPGDLDVMTDYAVVLRNLGKAKEALDLLNTVLGKDPGHWQALYNKVIVLNFNLHRHDEALEVLKQLEKLRSAHPDIPDLGPLRKKIEGS